MTDSEINNRSSGNINMLDRIARVVLGLSVLFAALYASITGVDAYPIVKLIAATVVLTGIAGWDPFYATFRTIMKRVDAKRNMGDSFYNAA